MICLVLICMLVLQNTETKQLVGPKHVTGLVDGSVTFKCMYSNKLIANQFLRKFLCREEERKGCITMISNSNFVADIFRGRASIADDKKMGTITVELAQLQWSDGGIYRCGIGTVKDGLTAKINLTVTEDSTQNNSNEPVLLYAPLRGTVTLMCDIKEQYPTMKIYLCKNRKDGCRIVIDSTGNVPNEYKGRVILNKGENPGSFSFKLVQLKNEDTGSYSCGFEIQGERQVSKVYDLNINEETDIPQGSRMLFANTGGSVSSQCNYNPKKEYTLKSWCKWTEKRCEPLANTDGTVQDTYVGRLAIYDNANGSMQVLMNQLAKKDEGWYWCVMTDGHNEQITAMEVKITEAKHEGLSGIKTFKVPAGQSVTFPCFYPCKYYSYQKYWCRWSKHGCNPLTFEDGDNNGLSVTCDKRELVLSIETVNKEHGGFYWCGVINAEKYGETMAVQLVVEEPNEKDSKKGQINEEGGSRNFEVDNTETSSVRNNNSTILAVCLSICATLLVVLSVFYTIKLIKRRNSDLVSVGSYRTNISMTDLDNGSHLGNDNPATKGSQETNIGQNLEGPKINKKGSQEELEYSIFLIQHNGKLDDDVTA
uniref:Polymeric immunoglobulin receptor n=1 Tax=Leptobrachium leishanense TaxID=445787 RepID=A0A8C5MZW4_9ANUR